MRRDMKNRDMKRPIHRLLGGLCAGVVCCILGACSDRADESGFSVPDGRMSRISLQPDIMPIAENFDSIKPPLARELNVKFSDSGFKEGDSVGFFSRGGKIDEGNNSTNFLNLPLVLNGRTFNSDILSDYTQADPGRMERIFSYYPYTEGAEGGEKVADIYAKEEGAEEKDEEGHKLPLRVIDFLTTNNSKDGATMNSVNLFYHTFAIVRVALGEGFKDFRGDIYLQLERKVKGVWIDMDFTDLDTDQNDWQIVMECDITSAVMKLRYDDTAVSDESRRLQTFHNGASGDNQRWDVIVPCRPLVWWHPDVAETCGVTVQAIVLRPEGTDGSQDIEIPVDNHEAFVGQMGGYLYGIRGSYIYTVRVEKNGFDASVFPVDVRPWTEQEIKETIPVGISDVGEYKRFIQTYNDVFNEEKDYNTQEIADKVKALEEWGTAVANGSGSTFTVFLTEDIDLTGMDNLMIHNLVIPIDGRGNTIRNCHLSGSLCKTIGSGGSLKNLRFENLRVVSKESDPIGLLAGTMKSGSLIDGCRVTGGWLEGNTSETKVGAAVGKMDDGEVKNCVFAGFMYGTSDSSYDDLVGEYHAGRVNNNNNRNNMTVVNN